MSPVWRPLEDPPCLDQFCHLSHDAQRVMVSIYEDFNLRKRELLQTLGVVERQPEDARNYYQSIYEARFGSATTYQNQYYTSVGNQQAENIYYPPHENQQKFPSSGAIPRNDFATVLTGVDSNQEEHDVNHDITDTDISQKMDSAATYDSSRYSDSPPIETQGYRFLSQLTRSEAKQEKQETERLNETGVKQNKEDCANKSEAVSFTGVPIFKHITIDQKDSSEGDTSSMCDRSGAASLLSEADNWASSQSLFSQDCCNDFKVSSRKKKSHTKTKKSVFKGKSSLFKGNITEKVSPNTSAAVFDVTFPSVRSLSNVQEKQVHVDFSGKNDRPASTEQHIDGDQTADFSGSMEGTEQTSAEKASMYLYSGESNASVKSNFNKLDMVRDNMQADLHDEGISKSVNSMTLEEESPINTSKHDLCHRPAKHTEASFTTTTYVDESPFGLRKEPEMVYDIFKQSSSKKRICGSPQKSKMTPAVNQSLSDLSSMSDLHMLLKLNKYTVELFPASVFVFRAPGMSKKRSTSAKGFRVPVKKAKTDYSDTKESKRASTGVTDVSAMSHDLQEQIISKLLESSEVVISLVYESGATQLRDSLFATETKKRCVVKGKRDKLQGIVCASKCISDSLFLFQFVENGSPFYHKSREFLLALLKSRSRKLGLHVKEIFIEILKYIRWDISKVDTTWTILDPILALWLLDPDNPVNSFDEVLSGTGMPPRKPSDSCLEVLYEDMMLLSVAMERLYQRLQSKELWDLFICLELKLTPLLAALELTSLSVATHTLMQFSEILKKKCTKLEREAHETAGHAFLLTSPPQLRQVLFEELRLDAKLPSKSRLAKTSVNNQTSTSESVLIQLAPFHPLPGIILEYRQVQKLKSTYIDGILSCVEDDCVRANWDQTAAATGRLTAYQPNVQAIPKIPVTISRYKENYIAGIGQDNDDSIDIYARDAFISQTGWTLLAADFQQIELRLLAHLADDPVLLKLFNDKHTPDIFNALTAQWLGKCVDDITTVEREQTKRVVYSTMYGVGKEKLAEHLKTSVDQAKAIMASFLVKFPAVKHFTQTCVYFCQKNGYCCSIFKRRRLIPNIKHQSAVLRAQAERQAVNFCVQGSAADICKAAMIQVVHALSERPEHKARLLMQIHDELLLEVADSDLSQVTVLVKEVMESSEKLCGSAVHLRVPLPVSLSYGKTWGHMEPAA